MKGMSITLFGTFQVRYGDEALPGLEGQKVQELFSYLLLHRGHQQQREMLATLLWSESSATQAKKYLRQALWQLQSALSIMGNETDGPLLMTDTTHIWCPKSKDISLDVADFETAYECTRRFATVEIDAESRQLLQKTLGIYTGDLLEGCYADWCLCERDRLQTIYLTMLNKMMVAEDARHEYEAGIEYGTRILRYDPACERTHQRLMRLYYLIGNRTAALRQYERCVDILRRELSVHPSRRTQALYEQIRTEAAPETPKDTAAAGREHETRFAANGVDANSISSLPEAVERLKRLGTLLSDLQCQFVHEIQAVEQTLKRVGTVRQPSERRDASTDV